MIKKFFFILICFLNLTFSYAETEFFCSNKNTYEIDNYKPELIEIKIHNYRKWQINNLRMLQDIAEKGRYSVIPSKYIK